MHAGKSACQVGLVEPASCNSSRARHRLSTRHDLVHNAPLLGGSGADWTRIKQHGLGPARTHIVRPQRIDAVALDAAALVMLQIAESCALSYHDHIRAQAILAMHP